jgi:hypothetical protein
MPGSFPSGRGPSGADLPVRVNGQGILLIDAQGTSIPVGGFKLPPYDNFTVSYVSGTDRISQVVCYNGATLACTINLTYNAFNNLSGGQIVFP